ncbi:MAG: hypothetical protein ACHQ2Y_04790 [Candidatus Lutacidiplasmatales archaeon]
MREVIRIVVVVFGATLLLLPSAVGSAVSTARVITMRPSFTVYGGLNDSGNRTTVNNIPYAGGSTILVAPSFNSTTGHVKTAQESFSQQGGASGLETWAGVYNLTFACLSSCASGAHRVTVIWNLSWAGSMGTNCSYYYSGGTWARASVDVVGLVYNVSNGRHALVGSSWLTVFRIVLSAPSYTLTANATGLVRQGLNLSISSGSSYEVEAFTYLHTWTHSLRGCISRSYATVSAPLPGVVPPSNPSGLLSVRVS